MIVLYVVFMMVILAVILQKIELTRFRVTVYEPEGATGEKNIRLVVLADLHGHVYGKNNERLLHAIEEAKPDLILIPGDLIVGKDLPTYDVALSLAEKLVKIAPVYFSRGNHEQRPIYRVYSYSQAYRDLENKCKELGVHVLVNNSEDVSLKGRTFTITGVDIPLDCFRKGKRVPLPVNFMEETLGKCKNENTILLAHNPAYAKEYASWGAKLTVSGHTHGGLVRIPGIGSVLSPQFELFPKYDGGIYDIDGKKIIVSKGLGTHTFHIRIFDRAEVVLIRLKQGRNKRT